MNKKLKVLTAFAVMMANLSIAVGDVRVQINWTGTLRISGFSTIMPGYPQNPDMDPLTMTFEWTIDDGSSHFISPFTCGAPTLSGSVVLIDALGPGIDENLDIGNFLKVAELLPPGTVDFPPGVTPAFLAFGSPISTIVMQELGMNLDTVLNVTQVNFNGNVLTFQVTENPALGSNPAWFLFNAEDAAGNMDGTLNRPFTVDITLEREFRNCEFSIPTMRDKSLLVLSCLMFFFGAGFLYRYGNF